MAGEDLGGLWRLTLARLDHEVAALGQPSRCSSGHPPLDVKPVHATVERHQWFVHPGLRGQHLDRPSGDIGSVGDHEVDTAPQDGGQRFEEIAFVHLACGGDVATGAPHRSRMDVDAYNSTFLTAWTRAMPTAPEPQHRSTRTAPGRATAAARRTRNSVRWRGTNTPGSTAIRRPQNSAQPRMCSSGRPTTRRSTHGREVARRPCCRDEQRCLVLGEHTADGLKPADDGEHDVVAGRAHAGHLDAIVGADVLAGVPCGDLGPAGEPASPVVHDGVLGEGGQERLGVLRVGGVDHLAYGGVELAAWALG